jgi:hypothetical protein
MARGLFWLSLLIVFFGLAWAGWNEFQKIEAYKRWAEQFDKAKYDIYAVLGKKGDQLTWGKPTRKDPINIETFSLKDVEDIQLLVNDTPTDLDNLPEKGESAIAFSLKDKPNPIKIPFTQIELAAQWTKYLQQQIPATS